VNPRQATLQRAIALSMAMFWAASQGRADEVPGSALASALAAPPELVDSAAQAFVHPQRAADAGSRVFSLDEGLDAGVVFVPGRGRLALFALGQTARASSWYESGARRTFQGGIACGARGLRLGAAFREGRTKDSREYESQRLDNGDIRRSQSSARFSLREFAAGLGLSRGRGSLDATAELARVEHRASGEDVSFSSRDEYATRIEGRTLWGGALFAAVPVSSRDVLRLAGAFRDRQVDLSTRATTTPSVSLEYRDLVYGHLWNAGAALEHTFAPSKACRLYAQYGEQRDPGAPSSGSSATVRATRRKTTEAGVSLQHPGWWGEILYVGVRGTLRKEWMDSLEASPPEVRRYVDSQEALSHAFTWGASRSIGDLDLVGLVSTSLSLSYPFASLDATLRF
jgi:hypothetical protein